MLQLSWSNHSLLRRSSDLDVVDTADSRWDGQSRPKSMASISRVDGSRYIFREFYQLIYWELCLPINVVCLNLFVLIVHDPDGPSISARRCFRCWWRSPSRRLWHVMITIWLVHVPFADRLAHTHVSLVRPTEAWSKLRTWPIQKRAT